MKSSKILIVGLGNPGPEYERTWHNLGFLAIDAIAAKHQTSFHSEKKFHALIAEAGQILLAKPQTFMNASGESVTAILHYYKILPTNIYLIHDDFAIPLGNIKISVSKGPANHHGVASLIDELNSSAIVRFRMGIGQPHAADLKQLVLSKIPADLNQVVQTLIETTAAAVTAALLNGVEAAMNQFNK